ncbi:dihydrodipicolinate synthase family protein [Nocardiopsis sp. B62]|uniref:dihydrodipicolinate synthase family protein n=1 Tax=Nocardiopsis sp. B62 TaxID=2824874 RepID=UPI001B39B875|nr:dihydrodipicolinate synthase family protein [Nocardiopsis sp. B62]MBQ1081026.1 dihydrodipicolinate synthase family protein [Nocardiopsis sp. B62]
MTAGPDPSGPPAEAADSGSAPEVLLPRSSGRVDRLTLAAAPEKVRPRGHHRVRSVYAAAHVVPLPWGNNVPGAPAEVDWDSTLGFRRRVWDLGLGVAEAMDTAQRNMGLDYAATRELVERTARAATEFGREHGVPTRDLVVSGVNTDQLPDAPVSLAQVVSAYREQLEHVESTGSGAVLMASRHLAAAARDATDYAKVYAEVLGAARTPVVLHWLGEAFDARLAGYFGSRDTAEAMDTVVGVIEEHADRVAGIKLSLLDAAAERRLRSRLPDGVRMYTGDDYNYVDLILGDGEHHSDALLGAFAAVTPQASAALTALEAGDTDAYRRVLGPTEELSRQVFAPPTQYYKTGVAFLAWLNGLQPGWSMVGGLHSARSLPHLARVIELADACGALADPALAARRWRNLLLTHGVTEERQART